MKNKESFLHFLEKTSIVLLYLDIQYLRRLKKGLSNHTTVRLLSKSYLQLRLHIWKKTKNKKNTAVHKKQIEVFNLACWWMQYTLECRHAADKLTNNTLNNSRHVWDKINFVEDSSAQSLWIYLKKMFTFSVPPLSYKRPWRGWGLKARQPRPCNLSLVGMRDRKERLRNL